MSLISVVFSFVLFYLTHINCSDTYIAVELIEGVIPKEVIHTHPKPCVTISRKDLGETIVRHWPRLLESRTPQWRTARPFGKLDYEGEAEFVVKLENYVAHTLSSSKSIVGEGEFSCKESDIDVIQPVYIKSKLESKHYVTIYVKCFVEDLEETLKHKKLFFVRHGESTWNLAQRNKRIFTLLTSRDNHLSIFGKRQALLACTKISCPVLTDIENDFVSTDVVYVSPLIRATQTAVLALKPILPRTGLVFDASLREKRNFGGKDSSGSLVGDRIKKEVCSQLVEGLKTDDALRMKSYCDNIEMDSSMIPSKWWQNSAETEENVHQRIENFLMKVRYSKQEKIIFVGHSHYFREMCKAHLDVSPIILPNESSQIDNPNLPFTQKIVQNLGAVYIDFDPSQEQMFASVQLLFDSRLV